MTNETPKDEQIKAGAVSDAELDGVVGGATQQQSTFFEIFSNILHFDQAIAGIDQPESARMSRDGSPAPPPPSR